MQKNKDTFGVTADYLFKRSNRQPIKLMIDDLVRNIDNQILCAHESGNSFIVYELPTVIPMFGIKPSDAKTIIYSELIEIYKKKGFKNIILDQQNQHVFIIIKWINGLTDEERQKRDELIRLHLKKNASN